MTSFLTFRLHGPMAAWGDVAIGGGSQAQRPVSSAPTRSAVLGLVSAALGIQRTQASEHTSIQDSLGFACRVDHPGASMMDYHTVQVPTERGMAGRVMLRRADELAFPRHELSTMLTFRDYRTDALALACLWTRGTSAWSLTQISEALLRPRFLLYLGRKNCPVDLPLAPRITEASHPVQALLQPRDDDDFVEHLVVQRSLAKSYRVEESPEKSVALRGVSESDADEEDRNGSDDRMVTVRWEGSDEEDKNAGVSQQRIERRWDDPRMRSPRGFAARNERVAIVPWPRATRPSPSRTSHDGRREARP